MRPVTPLLRSPLLLVFLFTSLVCALLIGFTLIGLSDFDLSDRDITELSFTHHENMLSGILVLPDTNHDGPIALLVHGDGPQDRFSKEVYLPLINALLDQGIGIYSWDKAGIGQSAGNWLDQSMDDRAHEAVAAYDMIVATRQVPADKVGFIGFSQAGWVIPKAGKLIPELAFNVVIGGAVNWQDQGAYYMRQRLLTAGTAHHDIDTQIAESRKRDAVIFAPDADYETYLAITTSPDPMTMDRYSFVKRNISADAKNDLMHLKTPFLALFGVDDLNVDALTDSRIYQNILIGRHPQNAVTLIPDATHGLLRSNLFNYQLASEMPKERQFLFAAMGRYAYVPDVIDHMANWIHQTVTVQ